MTLLLKGAAVLLAGFVLYGLLFVGRRGRNFPDGEFMQTTDALPLLRKENTGPPTLPIIGNLHQLPKQKIYFQ